METRPYLQLPLLCLIVLVSGRTGSSTPKPPCQRSRCKGDICVKDICSLGCKDGYYGRSCGYRCSRGCVSNRCSDSGFGTGNCTDGCMSGYWGSTCSFECPVDCLHCIDNTCTKCRAFLYGSSCSFNCRETCPTEGCRMDGTCRDDHQSIACANGNFGPKCQFGCNENCAFRACNRSSGVCLHGCEKGHFGAKCEFRCTTNCKGSLCDAQGRCLAGCTSGYYGQDCDEQCSDGCRQRVCDLKTGYCTNGCNDGHYGFLCNRSCVGDCSVCNRENGICLADEIQPEPTLDTKDGDVQITPSVNYVIGSVVLLIVSGTVAFLIRRSCTSSSIRTNRRLLSPEGRQLPDVPMSANAYDDINEDDMDESDGVVASSSNNTCRIRGQPPPSPVAMCHTARPREHKTGHLHMFKTSLQRANSLPIFDWKWNESESSWTDPTGFQALRGNQGEDRTLMEEACCLVDNVAYESRAACNSTAPRGYLSPVASDPCLDYTDF
ncbi:platelet endothelial aggregation receptor 1-like [Haliotis rubra]|uniref:platelet endothelial aggregation receptor 1-like n=1 Tax=Haliotis rubra TaxID=36100 RepID=UPI001EE58D88|nr:platelet endothelial aggregation receptor 1-like [Haliotis rubra]